MNEVSASTLSVTVSAYRTACTVRILAPYAEVAPHIPARSGTLEAEGAESTRAEPSGAGPGTIGQASEW